MSGGGGMGSTSRYLDMQRNFDIIGPYWFFEDMYVSSCAVTRNPDGPKILVPVSWSTGK